MTLPNSSLRTVSRIALIVTALCLAAPEASWAQVIKQAPVAEADRLWASGVEKIIHGEFVEAKGLLSKIIEREPGNMNFVEVASWLDRRDDLIERRFDLQRQQREQYIGVVKKRMEKEKWDKALYWARAAFESSSLPAEFMREPWMQELLDKAVELAEQYRTEGEWAKASGVYYQLTILFEGNKEYERSMEECISHSRIDAFYRTEDEEEGVRRRTNWKSRLQGVTQKMVDDALWKMHKHYVVEPDFKKIVKAGLERLLLLSESETIAELFPAMKVEDRKEDFRARLKGRIRRVDSREELSYDEAYKIFKKVLKINEQTVGLQKELVIYEFLEGALTESGPNDHFTTMIWPFEIADFEKRTRGRFTGVGIQISVPAGGKLTVVSPLADSPAFRAGIEAGDIITKVDGEPTDDITTDEAVKRITGPIRTTVVLTIHRPRTGETFDVPLIRDEIRIQSVKGFRRTEDTHWDHMIDPDFGIGYVRLTNFMRDSSSDLKKALRQLKKQGVRALILDLRSNPGGLLDSAVDVSELFLGRDKEVVSVGGKREGRGYETKMTSNRERGRFLDLPLVVLVDEHSASASEIVSGTLKEHKRALIVGQRTFGKGSVQNLMPVDNTRAHLKLTTNYYYLPGGKLIHRMPDADSWGVEPDIQIALVPREIYKVRIMNRDAEVIRSASAKENGEEVKEQPSPEVESKGELEGSSTDEPPDAPPVGEVVIEEIFIDWRTGDKVGDEAVVDRRAGDIEGEEGEEQEEEEEEEEEEEIPTPIELPDVDYQLETALLVLRVQLLGELGFDILPKVKLGAKDPSPKQEVIVTN